MNKKIIIGFLTLLLLSSGVVYITMNDVRIRVDNDKTTFYVPHEDYSWIWTVSGREYNSLFDGTSKMNRDLDKVFVNHSINGSLVKITRETNYIRGPRILDTYIFKGDIKSKELFPVNHIVEIFNGSGYFYRYEVRDLVYSGETKKLDTSEMSFGKNMKVEWQEGYRWAWVYKSGILKIQYDIPSDYEKYEVRLFDPLTNFSLGGFYKNITAELNSEINISVEGSGYLCLNIDHPFYGDNFTCDTAPYWYPINISWFRTSTLNDSSTYTNLTYSSSGNKSFWIDVHQYDEVHNFEINLTGYLNGGNYPENVSIYINNTLSNDIGTVYLGSLSETNFGNDPYVEATFNDYGGGTETKYIEISREATVNNALMNITGLSNTINATIVTNDDFDDGVWDTTTWRKETEASGYGGTASFTQILEERSGATGYINSYLDAKNDVTIYNAFWYKEDFNDSYDHAINFTLSFEPEQDDTRLTSYILINDGTDPNGVAKSGSYGMDIYRHSILFFNLFEYYNTGGVYNESFSIDVNSTTNNWTLRDSGGTILNTTIVTNSPEMRIGFDNKAGTGGVDRYVWTKLYNFTSISYGTSTTKNLTNVTLEVGTVDGDYEFNYSGNFNISSYVQNFSTEINNYILNECATTTCSIPIYITSDTHGLANLTNLSISYKIDVNPIDLNETLVQDFLDASSGSVDIPIKIFSEYGKLQVDDIRFDYAGGNGTVDISDTGNTILRRITFYYSDWKFSYPSYIDYLEFIPSTPTSDNVTPYGQTSTVPIFNITTTNYGNKNMDLSIYLNETHSCVNLTFNSTGSTKPIGWNGYLNNTWKDLGTNLGYNSNKNIWLWADYECNFTSWRRWYPELYVRGCCYQCDVCDTSIT